MKYFKLPVYALAAALMAAPTLANAGSDDDNEEPFDEAFLFFELNDTDGDLGIHGKIDGGPWRKMEIEGPDGPNERSLLKVRAKGKLRRQGMTELFFESEEPTFDELPPVQFFTRFPEGEYDVEGKTLDNAELESEVYLSHIIPAAPEVISVGGKEPAEDCDEGPIPVANREANGDVIIKWDAVTMSHAERWAGDPEKIALGRIGDVEVLYYEFVVEVDETPFKETAIIPPAEDDGINSKTIPADFFILTDEQEYKYEILVRTAVIDAEGEVVMVEVDGEEAPLPGNKSAVESCFLI